MAKLKKLYADVVGALGDGVRAVAIVLLWFATWAVIIGAFLTVVSFIF